jgi:hypothetical protein
MRTFTLPRRESRVVLWVGRTLIVIVCLQSVFFCWSIYRRIWQVQHIEALANSAVLVPGTTVGYDVLTSGEVHNLISLELIQGDRHEVLVQQRARINLVNTYNPFLVRSTQSVRLPSELLSRYRAGPATLRVTAFGSQKLLRTPPPRVNELHVTLAPAP